MRIVVVGATGNVGASVLGWEPRRAAYSGRCSTFRFTVGAAASSSAELAAGVGGKPV